MLFIDLTYAHADVHIYNPRLLPGRSSEFSQQGFIWGCPTKWEQQTDSHNGVDALRVACRPNFFLAVEFLSCLFRRLILDKLARPINYNSSASTLHSPMRAPSRLIWRRCATARGWSTPSVRSGGRRKACAISRATPIALPSPTAASSPSTRTASPSKWKDYRIEGPERYKQMPLDTHDACAAAHAVDPAAPAQLRQRRAASSRHPQWLVGRNRALQQRHQALVAIGEMLAHPLRVLERIIVGNNFNATLDHFLGDRMPFKFREQMAHVRHREQRTIIERRPNLIPTQAQQRKQPKWIIRLAIVSAGSAQYVVIDIEGGNQISPVPRPLKSRYGLFGRRNGRIKRRFVIGIEY